MRHGGLLCVFIFGSVVHTLVPNAIVVEAGRYTTTQIPDGRVAYALNNLGEIAGMTGPSLSADNQAIVWNQNDRLSITAAPTADDNFSCASSINDYGEVVGSLNGETVIVPFIWMPGGKLERLLLPPGRSGGHASAINATGDVAGDVCGPAGVSACLWTKGNEPQQLKPLPNDIYSRARAVNDAGEIVGVSGRGAVRHAVLWTATGIVRDLGTLPGDTSSEAIAINKSGDVVGFSNGPKGTRAFLWNEFNGMQDLGASAGYTNTQAFDINDSGTVVGALTNSGGSHAFIWTPEVGMRDLNSAISPEIGVVLVSAHAINNTGQIVAMATDLKVPCADGEMAACSLDECAPAPKYFFLLKPETGP